MRDDQGRWVDKRGRLVCWCGGYWFPHRKAGGACDHSPRADYYHAMRQPDVPVSEAMSLLSVDDMRRLYPFPGDT